MTALSLVFIIACFGMSLSNQLKALLIDDEPAVQETLATLQVWNDEMDQQPNFKKDIAYSAQARVVHTETVYIGGSEDKIVGIMRPVEIIQLMDKHPNLEGKLDRKGEVWLLNHVSELSQLCKQKGYIGLGTSGSLTLFEGKPEKEKVMRTFFQINVKSMETALPKEVVKQLHQGIRIQDLDEYNSVISTFSDFAMQSDEGIKR